MSTRILLTFVRRHTSMVFDEQVRECAMDMGTHLLARLGCAEDADDRKLRESLLRRAILPGELGIEFCRSCLIVVNAVETYAEEFHGGVTEARGSCTSETELVAWCSYVGRDYESRYWKNGKREAKTV